MTNAIRILLAQSNPMDSSSIYDRLTEVIPNIEPVSAESKDLFNGALEIFSFDLIVADLDLAGFEETEVVECVREQGLKTPLIVLVEPGRERLAATAMKKGANSVVMRTGNFDELIPPLVENILARRRELEVRHLLELELRESERRFKTFFDESRESMVILQHNRVIDANPSFLRLLMAKSINQVLGLTVEELFELPAEKDFFRDLDSEAFNTRSKKLLINLRDGRKNWADVTISRIAYKGRPAVKTVCLAVELNATDQISDPSVKRLRTVVDDAMQLAATGCLADAAPKLLESFAKALAVEGGSLYVKENQKLRLVKTIEERHQPSEIGLPLPSGSILDRAFSDDRPVYVQNLIQEITPNSSGWNGYKDNSLMVVKLQDANGNVHGVVTLHNKRQPPFTQADLQFGRLLGSLGLSMIKHAQLGGTLKEIESKRDLVYENAPVGITMIRSGKIVYANKRMLAMLGFDPSNPDELRGRPYFNVIPPEDRDGASSTLRKLFEDKEANVRTQMRLLNRNNTLLNVEVLATQMIHEGQSVVVCYFSPDQSEANSPIQTVPNDTAPNLDPHVRQFRQILSQTNDWITVTNLDGRITYVSPAVKTLMGTAPQEAIGKTMEEAFGPAMPIFAGQDWKKSLSSSSQQPVGVVRYQTRDRRLIIVKVKNAALLGDDGMPVGYVITAKDITRETELEGKSVAANPLRPSEKTEQKER